MNFILNGHHTIGTFAFSSPFLPNREQSVTRAVRSTGSLAHPSEIHFLLNSATRAVAAFATHRSCKLFFFLLEQLLLPTRARFAARLAASPVPPFRQRERQNARPTIR